MLEKTVVKNNVTIGIGDRGNELGLERVKEKVLEIVPNGVTIGCDVAKANDVKIMLHYQQEETKASA